MDSQDVPADIVLIHGLARDSSAMAKMAEYWKSQNWRVLNLDYPSTRYSIADLVDQIAAQIQTFRIDLSRSLYFVGHSLGSIITHFYIKKYRPENLGRVVALGPPYHGSAIIDHLGRYAWYRKLHGPAALELSTQAPQGIFRHLGSVDYELGVIAGDRCFIFDWFFGKFWLQQPNDGKVEIASTRIEGCRDHIILPVNHPFMPNYPIVIQQSANFISHGRFEHSNTKSRGCKTV